MGDQSNSGQAGQSVLSAQLAVGSIACPTGDGQFTSASGTTFACNGVPGPQGPQGDQGLPGPPGLQGLPGSGAVIIQDAAGGPAAVKLIQSPL